jgi:hypothetical protein
MAVMEKYFAYSFKTGLFTGTNVKAAKVFFLALLLLCTTTEKSYGTVWKTAIAGPVTTLGNWTNGMTSPTTFTTPGDTWNVTIAMTMPMPGTWTLGTTGMPAVTLTIVTGGTISMSGAGSTATINIYGDLAISGGTFTLGGAGTKSITNVYGNGSMGSGILSSTGATSLLTLNTYGNYNMTGGTVTTSGAASGLVAMNINGNFSMSAGIINANGASSTTDLKIYGNGSFSGTSAMTNTGASCTSTAHFSLPSVSGTMLIDNTSTGAWSGTNVFVDTSCTAQLDGNFSTTTGSATYGLTVNGTLICPALYFVNGTGIFTLNGVATLEAAIATGINGAITTTGTKTFSTSANYVFNGAVAQVTGSYLPVALVTPDTVTVSNSAGVTLSQTTATTGTLLFTSGILNTGAYTMSVPGAAASVVGAGAASYVNGTLIKTISGLTAVNYEVGDVDYAPMSLALSPAGTAGSLGLKATNGLHPSVGTSGLSAANMANHYWTITKTGATGPATIIPKATYNAVDIIGGSNSSFATQEYASSAWLGAPLVTTNTSLPYTSAPNTGVALATVAGDYIFGNIFCGTLPITGTTTLCAGSTTNLSDATSGGTWSSTVTTVATVSGSGLVTGIAGGTSIISYSAGACTVTSTVTVNPLPNAGVITGTGADTIICAGKTETLSDAAAGGIWSSSNTLLATVGSTGIVAGVAAGIDTIAYTVTNSCGTVTARLRVKVLSVTACHTYASETEKQQGTELKIFPNPNSGAFTMNLLSGLDEEALVVISNIAGGKVKEFSTKTNKEIDIKLPVPPGIYILTVFSGYERYNAKVIIR